MSEQNGTGLELVIRLTPEQLTAIAQQVAEIQAAQQSPTQSDGYLSTVAAAEYLATSPSRIHDLVQLRKLEPLRDGRRLLFRRCDLDRYLTGE